MFRVSRVALHLYNYREPTFFYNYKALLPEVQRVTSPRLPRLRCLCSVFNILPSEPHPDYL